jgi:SHS family lactate transporter-like MFS transporter
MISAASAQIEAIGGDHMKTTIIKDGKSEVVPDYAKVQGILLGTIAAFVIFITTIGPEFVHFLPEPGNTDLGLFRCRNHGSNFEQQGTAFEEADKGRSEDEEKLPDTRSEDISEKS